MKIVRYAYGITTALLLTGSVITLATGQPAGAQLLNENMPAPAAPPASAPVSFADLVERLQPAVVNISTRQRVVSQNNPNDVFNRLFGGNGGGGSGPQVQEGSSLGTGFLISGDGFIVTNSHVVSAGNRNASVKSITVTLSDHTEYEAELVGKDETADLAVLKIKPKGELPHVKFGSSKNSRVGDWVVAIGQPLGLEGTVTSGIISNIARTTGSGSPYDRFIQTDASINQGNSGGPMFDLNGNVIGVNTWIASNSGGNIGLGFAIPGEIAAPIVEKLMKGQTIERGYLGVNYGPLNDKLAKALGVDKSKGVFVSGVPDDGPAAKAGIKPRDVIVSVGGKTIDIDNPLSVVIGTQQIGKAIPVELIRNGKTMKVTATLTKRPSEAELSGGFNQQEEEGLPEPQFSQKLENENALGMALLDLNANIRRQLGLNDTVNAVVINGINRLSDAALVGLRRGDLITEIDEVKISSLADVDRAINAAKKAGKDTVLLEVLRPGSPRQYVPVEFVR